MRILSLSLLLTSLIFLTACQSENAQEPMSPEAAVQAARAVGVDIGLETYWADRGDGYGAYFHKLKYISLSGVGPTEPEMLSAINALRQFDTTIDSGSFKDYDARVAHGEVMDYVAILQSRREKLREKERHP